jgi:hypothetical protein
VALSQAFRMLSEVLRVHESSAKSVCRGCENTCKRCESEVQVFQNVSEATRVLVEPESTNTAERCRGRQNAFLGSNGDFRSLY